MEARSSAVNDLSFLFLKVRVPIDLMCHLPRIGYEEAGNQSFESEVARLHLSFCLCFSIHVPWCFSAQTGSGRGLEKKREE